MAFNEDLSLFFDTDDFAETVDVGGETVSAIFDDPTADVSFDVAHVEATDASMLVPTSAITWARNKVVTREDGSEYKSVRWQRVDDGALTRVFLNEVD